MSRQTLADFRAETKGLMEAGFKSRFGAMPLSEIDKPGQEHEHLIKGLLTRGEISMLVGPSGSGKSFLATHASLAIARGCDFMPILIGGRTVNPRVRRGGVLYIAGEGARGLKKRLRAYLRYWEVDPAQVPFVLLTLPVDLHNSEEPTNMLIEEGRHHAAKFMQEHGVGLELVVIDTLSASTPGANENTSEDVSRILGRCAKVSNALNSAVMLVHHMNAEGTKARGHSSLGANVDSIIEVRKTEIRDVDNRLVRMAKLAKAKDGEDSLQWKFVLPQIELGIDADGDPITSCVVDLPNEGGEDHDMTGRTKAMKLSPTEAMFFRSLMTALAENGTQPSRSMGLPNHITTVVDYGHVKTRFKAITAIDDEDPQRKRDKIKAALKRARESLTNFGVIGSENPLIWWTGKEVRGFSRDMPMPNAAPAKINEPHSSRLASGDEDTMSLI